MVKLVVQTILSRDKYSLSSVAERGASMMLILSWDVVAAGGSFAEIWGAEVRSSWDLAPDFGEFVDLCHCATELLHMPCCFAAGFLFWTVSVRLRDESEW